MKKFIFPLVAVLGFAACNPENENPMGDGNGDEIKLQMTQLSIDTRAPYMATTPSADAPLLARVLCSQTKGDYAAEIEEANNNGFMNFTAASTETSFCLNDGTVKPKSFPKGVNDVYLVGLYPAETWTKNAGTSASFNFDGSDDIMFAPETVTTRGEEPTIGTLAFGHKMTKINIQLRAVDDASIAPWGEIENIALTGVGANQPNQQVEISFADGKATFSDQVASLSCYGTDGKNYTDEPYAGTAALTTTATTVAYTICEFVDAAAGDEYSLTITSSTKGEVVVPFSLTNKDNDEFTGNTAGYAFTVTLSFSAVEIQAQATVTPWDEQGTTDVTIE